MRSPLYPVHSQHTPTHYGDIHKCKRISKELQTNSISYLDFFHSWQTIDFIFHIMSPLHIQCTNYSTNYHIYPHSQRSRVMGKRWVFYGQWTLTMPAKRTYTSGDLAISRSSISGVASVLIRTLTVAIVRPSPSYYSNKPAVRVCRDLPAGGVL